MVYITELRAKTPNVRLLRYQMQAVARHMLPNNRIKICLRYQREKYGTVDIFKHRKTQKAFYGGLMVCGNSWICPVCASKISERRKQELRKAFDQHISAGGHCTMLTMTFSHSRSDKLEDSLAALSSALIHLGKDGGYQRLRKELGVIGSVRAFEVTYGDANGFHPHIHSLQFHNVSIDPWERMEYQERFYNYWERACEKAGLQTSWEHGLRLDDAEEADQYIGKWGETIKSKWGIDNEMTKTNTKQGRAGSLTPFDFLRLVVEDGDLKYTDKFIEYSHAMKGKTQLKWSKGLKGMFDVEDKTDQQIAEEKEEPADRLGGLEWKQWKYILEHEYRVKLLELIEEHGYDDALKKLGIKKESAASNSESQSEQA